MVLLMRSSHPACPWHEARHNCAPGCRFRHGFLYISKSISQERHLKKFSCKYLKYQIHCRHYILYNFILLLHPSPIFVTDMTSNEVLLNGWTALPVDAGQLFNGNTYKNAPTPLQICDIKFPSDDPIVVKVQAYAKQKLPAETYNHSMRVYYYGKYTPNSASYCLVGMTCN